MDSLFRDCGLVSLDREYYHPQILFLEEYCGEKAIVFEPGEAILVQLLYRVPSGKGFLIAGNPFDRDQTPLEALVAKPDPLLGLFCWKKSKQGQLVQRLLERPVLGEGFLLTAEVSLGKRSPNLGSLKLEGVTWVENFSFEGLCLEATYDRDLQELEKASDHLEKTFNGKKTRAIRSKQGEIPF